jgi:hypothetical protein
VFFPRQWIEFQTWYESKRDASGSSANAMKQAPGMASAAAGDQVTFSPCVPTFISNRWWQEDPDKVSEAFAERCVWLWRVPFSL